MEQFFYYGHPQAEKSQQTNSCTDTALCLSSLMTHLCSNLSFFVSVDNLLAGLLSPRSLLTWENYLNFLRNQNISFHLMHCPENPAFSFTELVLR